MLSPVLYSVFLCMYNYLFTAVAGTNAEVGKRMLDMCGNNLQVAVEAYLDQGDAFLTANDPSGNKSKPATGSRQNSNHEDE